MSLRYAILGFLGTTPLSGYELGRRFSTGGGVFWEAVPSQIYRELTALEKLGWIATSGVQTDTARNKRVYHVTAAGTRAMRRWCEEPPRYPPERDPERVALLNMDVFEPPAIRLHLERHKAHHQVRRRFWQAQHDAAASGTSPRLNARLRLHSSERHAFVVAQSLRLFLGNVRRAELEIAWADEFIAWLDSQTL